VRATASQPAQGRTTAPDVRPAATAFRHRSPGFDLAAFHLWPDPAQSDEYVALVTRLWEEMAPFSNGGVYVNTLLEEGDQRVKDAYGPNYDRLAALKNKYDPDNFFCMNQNIRPSSAMDGARSGT